MADARTPIMNLRLPTPGSTKGFGQAPAGEDWASLWNACISALDSHNHGSLGVPIPASGVNINADLPFGGNDATELRSARFESQGAALNGASDLRCVFAVADDLYYRDGAGNQIRLTSGGALAGTPGSISGLAGSAAASWVAGSSTFEFTSAAGIFAHLKAANVLVTEPVSGGKSATIKVPTGLSANYQVTLPGALPAGARLVTLDNTGALAASDTANGKNLSLSGSAYAAGFAAVGTGSAILTGFQADGGTAVGVILNNQNALSTPGSKAVSIRNGGVEKSLFDANGYLWLLGGNPAKTTAITNAVTPMNVPKAWATFTTGAGGLTYSAGFNVSGVTQGAIDLTVTFAQAMADTNYAVMATSTRTDGAVFVVPHVHSKATGSVVLRLSKLDATYQDPTGAIVTVHVVVFGAN